MVMLSIADHSTRAVLQDTAINGVTYGLLFGVQKRTNIDVTQAFELAVNEAAELDTDFVEKTTELCEWISIL